MTFFIRNIALLFLTTALFGIALVSYLSWKVLYESMLNRILKERITLVETLGNSFNIGTQDTIAALDTLLYTAVSERRGSSTVRRTGVRSFRLVDLTTERILASTEDAEEGGIPSRAIPEAVSNVAKVTTTSIVDDEVVDITYISQAGLLWMTLDRSFFSAPAVVFALQSALVLTALICALASLFYLIARRYFIKPLQLLKRSLAGVVPEAAGAKADEFGALLESFEGIAQKVEETLERDRLVSQMKSDFISTTAHQLRTPLSGINWALGALLAADSGLKPEQRALVERALEKNKELIALVGTLLNAASIEEGKFGYYREPVSLRDELVKIVEEERVVAAQTNIQLSLVIPKGSLSEVFVDRERIRWVMRNLIENSIRYSTKDSEVTVTLSEDPKQVTVSVKDRGIGISNRSRPYIFQKFFRADAAQKMRNDGSGLGLFIAKNIVNYHGGRIWFETVEGKGSTFYFTLPVGRRAQGPGADDQSSTQVAEAPKENVRYNESSVTS